jgi:hypothetical protein
MHAIIGPAIGPAAAIAESAGRINRILKSVRISSPSLNSWAGVGPPIIEHELFCYPTAIAEITEDEPNEKHDGE